ncbi:uncharacterized protein LOC129846488 [Salvelinus fontinalis]|uniref:uncharacterized protein LOC129846488 n=1 Tax=Salvelinus fontinalis TaxID=8038 RepID=UPI0024854C00|nr:uncharacterized protein LOC129846488 [Salvelinus fontinalis]
MVTQVKSNPTFLAHRMANVRHRRHDRHPVDGTFPKFRLITWEPSGDFMKTSHVVNTPVQTMHIMGDLGPPGKLGQNEKECLLCTIRADGNGVITIKPDFNKVVSSAKGYQESYPIPEGHRGFISDARLLQMQRAEREAMEVKQRKISAIHENYVRTALIRVGSTFAHHFVPSIQCIPCPTAPPRPLPRRLEHIALAPLKNVVEVDGAQVRPGSHSLESIQVNKSFSSSSVWPVPVPPTGAPSKRGKKKKGRRGVKALKVQSDQGCADNNGPIDLIEEVRDIEAHLKEEAWKMLFDFVGEDDASSEVFTLQAAAGFASLKSTINGSLEDYGIRESTTLYVLWLSVEDVQPSLLSFTSFISKLFFFSLLTF